MHNTNIPCGCIIEYEGDQYHQDYSIDWCPLHDAAPELVEALKQILRWPQSTTANIKARAAITKATKDKEEN